MSPFLQTVYMWLCDHSDKDMTCFPSRKTLADECGMSLRTLDRSMQELVKLGMVAKSARHNSNEQTTNFYEVVLFAEGGDTGALGSDSQSPGGATETAHRTQPIINSTHLTNTIVLAKAYGKPEINEMFEYWSTNLGFEITSKQKLNRNACNNLIKKHGVDTVKRLVDGVAVAQGDKYAPTIGDFVDLQSKLNILLAWGKKSANKKGTIKI